VGLLVCVMQGRSHRLFKQQVNTGCAGKWTLSVFCKFLNWYLELKLNLEGKNGKKLAETFRQGLNLK